MKLIGWQNGRCGVVWRGVAIERRDLPRKQPTEGQKTPESSFKVSMIPINLLRVNITVHTKCRWSVCGYIGHKIRNDHDEKCG